MQSTRARVAILIGAVALIVVLFVVLQGGGSNDSGEKSSSGSMAATGKTPAIAIRDGAAVGGMRKLSYRSGDQIRFKVRADKTSDLHVHGYDIEKTVRPGKAVLFSFRAKLEGVFLVENHGTMTEVAELRVSP